MREAIYSERLLTVITSVVNTRRQLRFCVVEAALMNLSLMPAGIYIIFLSH